MSARKLYEAGALVEAKTSKGTWPIRIITEGKGSSGTYSRELLEKYASVFANRPMFGNHPADPNKPWERSPFDIKAKLGPTIEYREVDGIGGLYGEAIVDNEVDTFLEKFHDVVQVSIFASGDGSEDEHGEYIVESLDGADPYTSVDFVVAAGRGGGIERVLESFKALEDGPAPAASREDKKEQSMEISELAEKVDALTESLAALVAVVTPLAESLKPEEKPEVDVAAAVESAIDKAIESDIPKELRGPIVEAAKAGEDVDAAISTQKAIVDAVEARFTKNVQEGYFGGAANDKHDYRVTGLKVG